jgi:outer membrane protein assembly factor BamD
MAGSGYHHASIIAEPAFRMRVFPGFRILAVLALVVAAFALGGCSLFGKDKARPLDTLPVEPLYALGVESLDAHNFQRAGAIFTRLISRFPFGPYTEQSQINLAYAQYKNDKPDDAYSTINRFIKTYPTHKHVDYAYYLRGLINFDRQSGLLEGYVGQDMTKRDQVNLRQSFDDFGQLVARYPQSRYMADARQRMIYLRNIMAQSDLNVAMFYLRRSAYVAASNRAKSIVETYPRSPQAGDALAIMADSYHKLGQDKLATDAEQVLKLNYPNHPYFKGDWPDWPSNLWKLVPLRNRG